MQVTNNDISFDELKKRYDFLEFLPIYNVFSIFSSSKYHAKVQKSFCDGLSKGDKIGACDLHSVCLSIHSILGNLKDLFISNHIHTEIKWCEHLGYWIYDYIRNREPCSDSQKLYTQFQNIMLIYLPTFECNVEYFKITEDEYFKKKKIALYSEILYWIENSYKSILNDDPNLYDKYLDECYKFYKEIMCNKNSEIREKYETQLQKYKDNYNKTLSFLKGKTITISQTEIPSEYESLCQHVNQKTDEAEPTDTALDREDPALGEQVQVEPEAGAEGMGALKHQGGGDLGDKVTMITDDIVDPTDRTTSNPVGTIMGTSLGFFIPLTMLYKEVYEEKCPLSKLIKRVKDESNYKSFENMPKLHAIVGTNKDIIKKIGCGLYSGYDYLSARLDKKKRTDFCNYLNLWLDEQKSTHVNNESNITEKEWELIEELWNNLKQGVNISLRCDRQKEKNTLEIQKRINLMVYCVNRDYFMDLCSRAINNNNNIKNMCSDFSRFTDEYYEKFSKESGCFDDTIKPKDHRYFISENCDLHNMAITFPKFDSASKKILYNDISRKPIEECKSTMQPGGDHNKLGVVSTPLAGAPALTNVDISGTENIPVVPESSPAGLADYYGDTKDLAPPPPTDASLTDNGPSKPIYYAGLSVSGVFFTSMVLYKYTALGPLIRSLVSKKEKLRQATNKHLAEQWLQRTSEYMDSNSENAHYNYPYQSMQN